MKKIYAVSLMILAVLASLSASAQCDHQSTANGSPCAFNGVSPFCTDENPYGITYPSGTSGDANVFFGTDYVGCLCSMPCPAWYYMRVNTPGNLLIYIEQHDQIEGLDVDFACWGPFSAGSASEFVENLCCGYYNFTISDNGNGNHRPTNGDHSNNMGGYPYQNLVDCSYHIESTEWCYIPNAQTGQFYLLLITNYSEEPGTITFNAVNAGNTHSTATTDCSLLAQVTSNSPVCEGDTLKLYCQNPETGATYSWTGPNGWTSNVQNPVIPNATVAMSGTYTLVKHLNGESSDPASTTVTVNAVPEITLTTSQTTVCSNDHAVLTATGGGAYLWSTGETTSVIQVTPTEPIFYSVTVTSDSGCHRSQGVYVIPANSDSLILEDQVCLGARYNAHGFTLLEQAIAGDTILQHVYTNVEGCDSIVRLTLHRTILPDIEVVSTQNEHCGQSDGSIIVSVTGGTGTLNYHWDTNHFGDTLLNLPGGTYNLRVTDSLGCVATKTIYVSGMDAPSACFTLTPSLNNYPLGTAINFMNCSHNYTDWEWDLGDGTQPADLNPTYTYPVIGLYTVTLIVNDDNGCSDTIQKEVDVREMLRFYVPNSFSPNGDGLNDVFKPVGIEISETGYTMCIYNRWGDLVFMTHDLNQGWDGTVKNKKVEGGTVMNYVIHYENKDGRPYVVSGVLHVL